MTKDQARRWLEKRGYRITTIMGNPCHYAANKYGSPMLVDYTLNGLVNWVKMREGYE